MPDFNLGAALQAYKENSEIFILEPGTYRLECTSATAGTAKGGPTITPVFKVVGGPNAGKRVMVGKLSFAEGALWKTIPQIKGFGISEEFMMQANSQPDPVKTIADAMNGRVVDATVSVDAWQGEDRNKLVKVTIADDVPQSPVTDVSDQPSSPPVSTTGAQAPRF